MTTTTDRRPLVAATAGMALLFALALACGGKGGSGDDDGPGPKLEFEGGELHYKDGATKADAQRLGEYLVEDGYFDGDRKSVQLVKDGETWKVRLVVNEDAPEDDEYKRMVGLFGMQISNRVFDREPVSIDLCDDRLETVVTIDAMEGTELEFNGATLYHTSDVEEGEAQELGEYLVETGVFDGTAKSMYLDRDGDTLLLGIITGEGAQGDATALAMYAMFGLELSGAVFDGQKVHVQLCDQWFTVIDDVESPHGKLLVFNEGELYYADPVTEELATELGELLVEEEFFDGTRKSLRLTADGDVYVLQMVVKPGFEDDPSAEKTFTGIAGSLSEDVFDGKQVDVHLCDAAFETLRVYSSK